MSAVMTVYKDGRSIGEIRDFGPGRIMAYDFIESGRVRLGFFPTRAAAREAIEARHAGGQADSIRRTTRI